MTLFGQPLGIVGAVLFGLFCYGVMFAMIVWKLGKMKEGYTALLVVAGVLITLGGVAVISWQSAVLCLVCFTASGLPMVIGDIAKYIALRERDRRGIGDH